MASTQQLSSLRTRAHFLLILLPLGLVLLSGLMIVRCLDPSTTLEMREALASRERFILTIEDYQKRTGRNDVIVFTSDGSFFGKPGELDSLRNALGSRRSLFSFYETFALPSAGVALLLALGALGAGAFAIHGIERRPRHTGLGGPVPPATGPLAKGIGLLTSLMLAFFCAHVALVAICGPFISGEIQSPQGYLGAACAVAALFIFLGALRLLASSAPAPGEGVQEEETGEHRVLGRRLQPEDAPPLFAFIGDITARAGLAPPDNIVVGSDEGIFALRDRMLPMYSDEDAPLKGLSLYLSLPVLSCLTRDEAGAAIAHTLALASTPDNSAPALFSTLSAWERRLGKRLFFLNSLPAKPALSLLAYAKAHLAQQPDFIRQYWRAEIDALKAGARIAGGRHMAFVLTKLTAVAPLAQAASFDAAGKGGADGGATALLREAIAKQSAEEREAWAEAALREFEKPGGLETLPDGSTLPTPSAAGLFTLALGVSVDRDMAHKAAALHITPLPHELGLTDETPDQAAPLSFGEQAPAARSAPALSRKLVDEDGSLLDDCAATDEARLRELAARNMPPMTFRRGGLIAALGLGLLAAALIYLGLDPRDMPAAKAYLFLGVGACLVPLCLLAGLSTLRGYITLRNDGFLLPGARQPVPWNRVTALGIGSAGSTGLKTLGMIITIGVEPEFLRSFDMTPGRRVYCDAKRGMLQTHVGEFSKRQSAKLFIDTFNACRCAALAREKLGIPHPAG